MGKADGEGLVPAGRRDSGRGGRPESRDNPQPQESSRAAAGAHAALKRTGWGKTGLYFNFGFSKWE